MGLMLPPVTRPISVFQMLTCHPILVWQFCFGVAIGLLAWGAANAGAGYVGILLLMLSAFAFLMMGMTLHGLLTYDLPLLRTGLQVKAVVRERVAGGSRHPLYHIAYLLPGPTLDKSLEYTGLFMARNGFQPAESDPVVVLVSRDDPQRLLEVSGLYEQLIPPVWNEQGASTETVYRALRSHQDAPSD